MRWTVLIFIVALSSHAFARDCDRWGYCRNSEMYRARDTYIPPPFTPGSTVGPVPAGCYGFDHGPVYSPYPCKIIPYPCEYYGTCKAKPKAW